MYAYAPYVCLVPAEDGGCVGSLELELQVILKHSLGSGYRTQVLRKSVPCEPSLQPCFLFISPILTPRNHISCHYQFQVPRIGTFSSPFVVLLTPLTDKQKLFIVSVPHPTQFRKLLLFLRQRGLGCTVPNGAYLYMRLSLTVTTTDFLVVQ